MADLKTLRENRSGSYIHQHMSIPWDLVTKTGEDVPVRQARLREKTGIVARVGLLMLSCGTAAWRVRNAINQIAVALGISCTADIGLTTLSLTCFEEDRICTETLSLKEPGVNTDKLDTMEQFVIGFPEHAETLTSGQVHELLDDIAAKKGNYKAWQGGLSAAIACCGFTFLLGGGIPEMICAFLGAGFGNWLRRILLGKKIALIGAIIASVSVACAVYVGAISLAEALFHVSGAHEAGYICAMLFVIPGFPLITGGLDIIKVEMRSGLERIAYALLIILTATLTGWVVAMLLHFKPGNLVTPELSPVVQTLLRLVTSFAGVYGFSQMFNSPRKMAVYAGCIGMIANTLRLVLVDYASVPAGAAAFVGALVAGLLASLVKTRVGLPRIALTVPSIVIMVPGMYMYRGIFNLGVGTMEDGLSWIIRAVLIVMALPLGLAVARLLTDTRFRHCT